MNGNKERENETGEEEAESFYDDEFSELEQEWAAVNTELEQLRAERDSIATELAVLREQSGTGPEPITGEPAAAPETPVPTEIITIEPESSHWLYHRLWGTR